MYSPIGLKLANHERIFYHSIKVWVFRFCDGIVWYQGLTIKCWETSTVDQLCRETTERVSKLYTFFYPNKFLLVVQIICYIFALERVRLSNGCRGSIKQNHVIEDWIILESYKSIQLHGNMGLPVFCHWITCLLNVELHLSILGYNYSQNQNTHHPVNFFPKNKPTAFKGTVHVRENHWVNWITSDR